jgi:hypothetical protein
VLGYEIIEKSGLVMQRALGVVLLCWRRMARAGLVSGVVGFILVEIAGALLQHKFPGPDLITVVALIFALVVAYAVALTVFIDELFIGAIDMIKVLQGDTAAGARALAIATERRAGEAGSGVMRWLGVRPSRSSAAIEVASSAPEGLVFAEYDNMPYSAEEQWQQTQADVEATDEFLSTAPRPRVNARPVQADQLPRITWAMERLEQDDEGEASSTHPDITQTIAPRVTRPITRPLPAVEEQSQADPPRGIWSRISKTLVGNVHPPIESGGEESTAEVLASEESY